jgi:hypothetical protein
VFVLLLIPLYIDPATTSYIIQVVAGLVITLGVAAGVAASRLQMSAVTLKARAAAMLARLRRGNGKSSAPKASNTPDPSGTASSETDDRASQPVADADTANAAVRGVLMTDRPGLMTDRPGVATDRAGIVTDRPGVVTDRPKRERVTVPAATVASGYSWKRRATLAAPVAFAIPFTVIFFGMFDLIIRNHSMLPFVLSEVVGTIALSGAAVAIAIFLVLLLVRDVALDVFVSLGVGGLLALYIQGNFLNAGLGLLTGDYIEWDSMRSDMLVNAALWGVMVLVPLVLRLVAKQIWLKVVVFLPLLLVAVQGVALISTAATSSMPSRYPDTSVLTTQGLYSVSPGQNVIVIILDRLDDDFVEEVLRDDRQFFDGHFDDFTRFTNNMAVYSRTFPAVINMLSGAQYGFDMPAREWVSETWRHDAFLQTLADAGWSSYLFGEQQYVYYDATDLTGLAANIAPIEHRDVDQVGALRKLLKLSLFRYGPLAAKPRFHMATTDFQYTVDARPADSVQQYYVADRPLHDRLLTSGLELDPGTQPRFTYLHLIGAHGPYIWGPHMETVDNGTSSQLWQTRGAFTIVFQYLESLKRLGVYDDATIIVTGDHGWSEDADLAGPTTVGLFVKPAGATGNRMRTNNAPVSQANLRATVIDAMGLDNTTLGFGPTYFQVPNDPNTVRYFNQRSGHFGGTIPETLVYEVRGDARAWNNWRLTGRYASEYDEYS